MHSELSEALEEYRNGKPAIYHYCNAVGCICGPGLYSDCDMAPEDIEECAEYNQKPEGIAVEFADCIIRILDTCAYMGYDIDEAIRVKMTYNESRPYRHGGKKV
jgi:NTP pyrophosphatase (non-canonical NTP hydrolase)